MDKMEKQLEEMIVAYAKADLDQLLAMIKSDNTMMMFADELLDKRNVKMAERIEKFIKEKSTFSAVGAGHLPGANGIIALLKKEGYSVEPVIASSSGF